MSAPLYTIHSTLQHHIREYYINIYRNVLVLSNCVVCCAILVSFRACRRAAAAGRFVGCLTRTFPFGFISESECFISGPLTARTRTQHRRTPYYQCACVCVCLCRAGEHSIQVIVRANRHIKMLVCLRACVNAVLRARVCERARAKVRVCGQYDSRTRALTHNH